MAQNGPELTRQDKTDARPGETFSLFLTRILDQLSLSAWLPAIMLICNLGLVLQLRSQHNFDLGRAITNLTEKPLGILIVLLLSIVIASIVTQAFEFEVIRLLEGYWGQIRLLGGLSTLRTKRHTDHLAVLEKRYRAYARRAFTEARLEMLENNVPRKIVNILEKQHRGEPLGKQDQARVASAERLGWRPYAPPELLRRMDATESLILEHPRRHRILPTRLGNTLRSSEDRLSRGTDENLDEFVYRRYDLMSPELKAQHDQFRCRLNIYCLLTLIFSSLAIVSPLALVHRRADLVGGAVFFGVYALLAIVSYQAAIASARGYVSVLRVVSSRSSAASQS